MNGIDKITEHIQADARAEADALLMSAQTEADGITADFNARIAKEVEALTMKGKLAAVQREERLASVAALDARKAVLAAKQEMVAKAFDRAMERLCTLPDEEYIDLLAGLAVKAARTGREQVLFSQKDRARVGKAVVMKANELLAKRVTPTLPEELSDTKAGAFLEKMVTGASALLAQTGMLTLSEKTAPILGGLILADGDVEVNCAFETLVRLARNDVSGQVAKVLFE